ncbi:hypothetical protein, partial [Neisseria subflava]|uniref:hypothetical protein n=1 Tax=Neisseria subflava TaxID=28449 RepID=UPI004040BE7F
GGKGGVVAEFALLNQFVAGVVAVAGELMIETAFCNQSVEGVIGKAVARTVFIGEANRLFSQAYLCQYFLDKNHREGRLRIDFRRP